MLHSMTGFGRAEAHIEGVDYAVEIRSVNGRYFKASVRLPEMWSHAEADVEKLLREKLRRGTVTLSLRMRIRTEAAAHTVNEAALANYVRQVRSAIGDDIQVDAGTMLALPGVCEPPSADELCEKSRPALMETIEGAIQELLDMRRQEGEALETDLLAHCQEIERQLGAVEERKGTVVAEYQKRLLDRVNELVNSARLTVNEEDLIREVAVFAERSDISEEISRLRSHVDQFRQCVQGTEQDGRKLEFIGQEMHREANTISSKANDGDIIRATVEIRSRIDKIKEQVQNVE
jgi:uncharacterized protein (TIGR00255 family)